MPETICQTTSPEAAIIAAARVASQALAELRTCEHRAQATRTAANCAEGEVLESRKRWNQAHDDLINALGTYSVNTEIFAVGYLAVTKAEDPKPMPKVLPGEPYHIAGG